MCKCVQILGKEKSFLSRSIALVTDLLSAFQINSSNSHPSAGSGGEVTDITETAVPVMRNLRCDASESDDGPGSDVNRLAVLTGITLLLKEHKTIKKKMCRELL